MPDEAMPIAHSGTALPARSAHNSTIRAFPDRRARRRGSLGKRICWLRGADGPMQLRQESGDSPHPVISASIADVGSNAVECPLPAHW
jgi:hypothetical protein